MSDMMNVGKPVRKIDSLSLATGNERFTDDFQVENPLWCSILY